MSNVCLSHAMEAFPFDENIVELKPFGSGHINDTYAVWVGDSEAPRLAYILQRLNTNVFTRPKEVMQNIFGVTEFLHDNMSKAGQSPHRNVLRFLKTKDGQAAFFDAEGMPWRSYHFIENSFCYDKSPSPDIFYQSARAFGDFLCRLQDYPAHTLHETIPGFHDTPQRLRALRQAAQENRMGRASSCMEEIEFALKREEDAAVILAMQQAGKLPLRVTHNDTKLNNVLFDKESGEAICVIDLDTIMPGLSLNDFGDSIRYGATTAAEDEPDISLVHFSLTLFEAYTKGYLETAGPALTTTEKEMLPQGARILTLECGARFLTDYLNGDAYFKVERPLHNLQRCRTQFKLVGDMEGQMDSMCRIVAKYS